jgi:hypothetical protein
VATIDDVKRFLSDEYQRGCLPSHPSLLFSAPFLEHLVEFMSRSGIQMCPRCAQFAEGLRREIDRLALWARSLPTARTIRD